MAWQRDIPSQEAQQPEFGHGENFASSDGGGMQRASARCREGGVPGSAVPVALYLDESGTAGVPSGRRR